MMRSVKQKDTKPELIVRKLIHGFGYRYRLHRRNLPGTPDLVFPSRKKVIFVHGCFWHQHPKCKAASLPKSNKEFWTPKLQGNVHRDKAQIDQLRSMGWEVLVVWECEVRDMDALASKLKVYLEK